MLSDTEVLNTKESILNLSVEDIHSKCDCLTQQNVTFLNAPHMIHKHEDVTEEWIAFFEDLEKRPLELMSVVRH